MYESVKLPFLFACVSLFITAAAAASAATINGTVTGFDGQPAAEVRVILVESNRTTFTADDGSFTFEDVSPGSYHLQAISRGKGSVVEELDVTEGANAVTMQLSIAPHREKIIVTATRAGSGSSDVVQPANVLSSEIVLEKTEPTLGQTLGREAGVTQTFFGAGASRPIIRGLDGGRVRMLELGLGAGDVSDTSPDHAVAIDPLLADQIEVLRGASTLLYGSSAVGGVVNVIDRRIPDSLPANPMKGTVSARMGTVADERTVAADLTGRAGHFAWHVDAAVRETDDYEVPGAADLDEPDERPGTLENSDLESSKFTGGLSHVWENKGFIGASFTRLNSLYGIPGGHAHGHEEDHEDEHEAAFPARPKSLLEEDDHDEETIRIDLKQEKIDLRGGVDANFGPFNSAQFSLAAVDYEHTELEGSEIGTVFGSDYLEGRAEIHNGQGGKLRGTIGMQYVERDLTAIGEEAFLPANTTKSLALFALQRLRTGAFNWELGLRFETQDNTVEDPALDRDFDGVSGSAGLLYRWGDDWGAGLSLTHTDRLPSGDELYSLGAHLSTRSYEVGNPDLQNETANGVELTVRRGSGHGLHGALNLFYTRFDDYIFLEQQFDTNGDPILEDDLPLFTYEQRDSEFYGYELELYYGLLHSGANDLDVFVRSDSTTAELRDTGQALPRIPAQRYSLGADLRGPQWGAMIEVAHLAAVDGDDVAASETPTTDSTVLNASVSRRFVGQGVVHSLILRGSNLTNEDVRLHTSRLKDTVPLPGLDISVIYRLEF